MIRNRCENFGDGLCHESRNIKVLKDYLEGHGLKAECHARPERPERLNLLGEHVRRPVQSKGNLSSVEGASGQVIY